MGNYTDGQCILEMHARNARSKCIVKMHCQTKCTVKMQIRVHHHIASPIGFSVSGLLPD